MYSDQQHNPFVKVDYDQSEGMTRLQNNSKRPILNNKVIRSFEDKKSPAYLLRKTELKYQIFKEHQEKEKKENDRKTTPESSPEKSSGSPAATSPSPFLTLNKAQVPSVFEMVKDIDKETPQKNFPFVPSVSMNAKDKFSKLQLLLKERKPVVTAASSMMQQDFHLLGANLNENFDIFEVGSEEESLVEPISQTNLLNNSTQSLALMHRLRETDDGFLESLAGAQQEGVEDISFFPAHVDDSLSVRSNLSLSLELYKQSLEHRKILTDDSSNYSNPHGSRSQLNLLSLTQSQVDSGENGPGGQLLLTQGSTATPLYLKDAQDDSWSELVDAQLVQYTGEDSDEEDNPSKALSPGAEFDNESLCLSLVPAPVLDFQLHKDDLEANITQLKHPFGVEVSELDASNFQNRKEAHLHFLKNTRSKYNLKTLRSIIDLKALPDLERLGGEGDETLPRYDIKGEYLKVHNQVPLSATLPGSPEHEGGTLGAVGGEGSLPSVSASEDTGLKKVSSFLSPVKFIKSLVKKDAQIPSPASPISPASPTSPDLVAETTTPSRPSTAEPQIIPNLGSFFHKLNPLKKVITPDSSDIKAAQTEDKEKQNENEKENEKIQPGDKKPDPDTYQIPEKKRGFLSYFESLLAKYTEVEEEGYYDIASIPYINRPASAAPPSTAPSSTTPLPPLSSSHLPPNSGRHSDLDFDSLHPFQTNYLYRSDSEKKKALERHENQYGTPLMDRQQFLAQHGSPGFLDPNQVDLQKSSETVPVLLDGNDVKTINTHDFSLNYDKLPHTQQIVPATTRKESTDETSSCPTSAEDILRIVEQELQAKHSELYQISNDELIQGGTGRSYSSPLPSSPLPSLPASSSPFYSPSPALTSSYYSPSPEMLSRTYNHSASSSPLPPLKKELSLNKMSPLPLKGKELSSVKELSPVKTPRSKYYPVLSETDKNRPAYGNVSLYQDDDDVSYATMTSIPKHPKSGPFRPLPGNAKEVPQLSLRSHQDSSRLVTPSSLPSYKSSSQIFSDNEEEDEAQTPMSPLSINQLEENLSIELSERATEDISRSLKKYPSLSKMIYQSPSSKNKKAPLILPAVASPVKPQDSASSVSSASLSASSISSAPPSQNYSKPFEPKMDVREDILVYLGSTNSPLFHSYKDYYTGSKPDAQVPLIRSAAEQAAHSKHRLQQIMQRRYARDEEGLLENQSRAKQHMLEGYGKQTKINKEYLDLLEDW